MKRRALAARCLLIAVPALLWLAACTYVRVRKGRDFEKITFDQFVADRLAIIRDQAREDLHCSEMGEVTPIPPNADLTEQSPDALYVASGCGHRIVYVQIPSCDVYFFFIPITQPIADVSRYGAPPCPGGDMVKLASHLSQLTLEGARDLDCPREQVTPVDPNHGHTYVVEGCGKRAYYLPGVPGGPIRIVAVPP